jgi:WD40 repeat protein
VTSRGLWLRKVVGAVSVFATFIAAGSTVAQNLRRVDLVVQTGHSSTVRSVAFSPDGKILASLGLEGTIKLWDIASGKQIRSLGNSEATGSLAFSPDGKTIATASFKTRSVMLFSVVTGELIKTFPLADHVIIWQVRFSPDGETIATVGYNCQIKFWNVRDGTERRTVYRGSIGCKVTIDFSPDGKYLAAASDDNRIWMLEVGTEEISGITTTSRDISSITFSPDGRLLAEGGSGAEIKIFDVRRQILIRAFPKSHSGAIMSLAFSADGKTLASGGNDGSVKLWNVDDPSIPRTLSGHSQGVQCVAFSPTGNTIASGGADDTIKIWNAETADVRTLAGVASTVFSIDFSPNGRTLAMAREDKVVQIWNAESGNEVRTLVGHADLVWTTAFSPDAKLLASGSADRSIRIWDLETGRTVKELLGHAGAVKRLAFSPDGKTLASGDSTGRIILWNVGTGEKREIPVAADIKQIDALVFSPDGSMLASSGWQPVKLWDVTTLGLLRDAGPLYSMVSAIAFSRDGKTIAMNGNKQFDVIPAGSPYVEEGNKIRLMTVDRLEEIGSYSLDDAAYRTEFEKQFPTGFETFYDETVSDSMIAKILEGSRVQLFYRAGRKELAALVTNDDNRWTIVSPDGRFDTNKSLDDIEGMHWIDSDAPFTPVPLEIFMRQYEPGLITRLLKCTRDASCSREFKPPPSIAELNRVQPGIGKPRISATKPDGTVDVSIDVEDVVRSGVRSGVFDLRLFIDRRLVASSIPRSEEEKYIAQASSTSESEADIWRRTYDVSKQVSFGNGKGTYVFRNVRIPRTGQHEIEFSAYAFNADRVKSDTVRTMLTLPSSQSAKGKTILLTIGVNASESANYRLDYAANDAHRMQEVLGGRLAASGHDLVRINLVSDFDRSGRLTENLATKKIIKGVFDVMAGRRGGVDAETLRKIESQGRLAAVQPEDTLIITYSGHGYTRAGVFYILPYDIGENTGLITDSVLPRLISSDELSLWMREIVAKEILFVVDACHSAASVQGADFKPGPMGSRGLGQLAYDKGMRVLAAAQTNNVALELKSLQHGLLSYALLEDGIARGLADSDTPKDGMLTAGEWLGYAVKGVPALYKRVVDGKAKIAIGGQTVDLSTLNEKEKAETFCEGNSCRSRASVQQPVLFDFARSRRIVPLIKLGDPGAVTRARVPE